MNPVRVLQLVRSLGGNTGWLRVVGCEPAILDSEEGAMGLSEKVQAAVDPAIEMIESLIREILQAVPAIAPRSTRKLETISWMKTNERRRMNTAEICWLALLGGIVLVAVDLLPFHDPGDAALLPAPQHVVIISIRFYIFHQYVSQQINNKATGSDNQFPSCQPRRKTYGSSKRTLQASGVGGERNPRHLDDDRIGL